MDRFAFVQIDKERASLIDHIGACERILKTPLPMVYAIKIRRFIALFLLTLPFALLNRINGDWLVPFITMMVAYPLVSLDQIGIELQNPFCVDNLSHLPLDERKTINFDHPDSPETDLLIQGGRAILPDGENILDIAVRGGRIVALGNLGNVKSQETIDARGLVVMPGLLAAQTTSTQTNDDRRALGYVFAGPGATSGSSTTWLNFGGGGAGFVKGGLSVGGEIGGRSETHRRGRQIGMKAQVRAVRFVDQQWNVARVR